MGNFFNVIFARKTTSAKLSWLSIAKFTKPNKQSEEPNKLNQPKISQHTNKTSIILMYMYMHTIRSIIIMLTIIDNLSYQLKLHRKKITQQASHKI